ncbi:NUDIX domain-containing protein [Candidatus Protofrankia californiensis]|uniref:NUDIX domain-containing protein n=1 Tax=Candidatus Protofrankia californiensis TaxID=1839754 RepID=UPI0010418E5D|nr:NUDIX domain-containing protein [Candidatus Protofrankia californiensis]
MTDYTPADITPAELQPAGIAASIPEGWAIDQATDPAQITDWDDRQAVALIPFEVIGGYPRNPAGRTGKIGRNLRKWGENQAADPIVVTGTAPGRRVLLIRRDDCGHWAIPGGMVDPGETAPAALIRELREETGVDLHDVEPVVLTRTYVDDPRNTDWAWITSTVALFQVPTPVDVAAGSDALDARWWPFDGIDQLRAAIHEADDQLYAPHEALLMQVPAPDPLSAP